MMFTLRHSSQRQNLCTISINFLIQISSNDFKCTTSDQGTLQSQLPPTGLLRKVLRIPSWRLRRHLRWAMHHQHVPGEVFVYLRFANKPTVLPIQIYAGRMQRFPKPSLEANQRSQRLPAVMKSACEVGCKTWLT